MYLYQIAAAIIDVDNLKRAIWLIIFGMIIALVFIYFTKVVNGALVRALMENGVYSPESAKTLDELGFDKKANILKMYKRSAALGRIVGTVEEEADESAHFYIREEETARAAKQYGTNGNELMLTILGAVALIIVGILAQTIL